MVPIFLGHPVYQAVHTMILALKGSSHSFHHASVGGWRMDGVSGRAQ